MYCANLPDWRRSLRFAARLVGVMLVYLALGGISANVDLAAADPNKYLGPAGCASCHSGVKQDFDRDFVLLREREKELLEDKHVKAYEVLQGDLGQRICKTLSINLADLKQARQCLSCHADWPHASSAAGAAGNGEAPPTWLEKGVTCEACHGPSYNWDREHRDKATWRTTSPADKEKRGFHNVRDPRVRAEICLSCHLGNLKQEKFITHEMYAAGHPPLPSIELETFAQQMPRHWRYPHEKGEFDHRAEYLALNYGEHPPAAPQTRMVLVGGLMVLKAQLALYADLAAAAEKDPSRWPELAVYDCAACHHDLSLKSWRQDRGLGGVAPGRPPMPAWTTALIPAALAQAVADDPQRLQTITKEYHERLNAVRTALAARPFGDPREVRRAAPNLTGYLDERLLELEKTDFDLPAARRTILSLGESAAAKESPDFHSARQLAWALQTIGLEVRQPRPQFARQSADEKRPAFLARTTADIEVYDRWVKDDLAKAQAEVARLLDPLSQRLRLALPAGQKNDLVRQLPAQLQFQADYTPDQFPALFKERAAALLPGK